MNLVVHLRFQKSFSILKMATLIIAHKAQLCDPKQKNNVICQMILFYLDYLKLCCLRTPYRPSIEDVICVGEVIGCSLGKTEPYLYMSPIFFIFF